MNEINLGMGLVPEVANLLRGIKETPGLPFEILQERSHLAAEAHDTARTAGSALLIELADILSHQPPLTGNLILRLTATEEKNEDTFLIQ